MAEQQEDDWFAQALVFVVFAHPILEEFLRQQFRNLSEDDVEEIIARTAFQAWANRAQFNPQRGSLLAWLCGIARYAALSLLRERKGRREMSLYLLTAEVERTGHRAWFRRSDKAGPYLSPEQQAALKAALDSLPDRERTALMACAENTGEQWASELEKRAGGSSSGWRNAAARAKPKMRAMLKAVFPNLGVER